MAAKFFSFALLQQIRRVQSTRLLNPAYLKGLTSINSTPNVQYLHVKRYDKDLKREPKEANIYEPTTYKNEQINAFALNENESEHLEVSPKTAVQDEDFYFEGGTPLATDEVELAEEEYEQSLPNRKHRLRPIDYARLIKEQLVAKRLNEAIAILEQRMLKQDRVKPDKYIYNLLISACAKAGQTSKAFNLFAKMRERGLDVNGGIYTSLFNACANCNNPAYALQHMQDLREIMLRKNHDPNIKHYHAMMKAFGRCGQLESAFQLVEEMVDKNVPLTTTTYNFLLQACASNVEQGFRHCLLTWHKMLAHNIKPDYFSFKTVLRCVRDCGFGDYEGMQQVLQQLVQQRTEPLKLIPDFEAVNAAESSEALVVQHGKDDNQLEVPNLLLAEPHLGSLVSLAEVTKPHERFLLLGGITGYLDQMKSYGITPDIQFFTAMLEVVPPTYAAEKQIIGFIRRIGLKADIDFFNVLIKKRAMRFDYEGGKEVLSMIRTAALRPDIVTYGVLALGCQRAEEAQELLQEMQRNNVR